MQPLVSPDDRQKAQDEAVNRAYAKDALRSSGIGAVVVGIVLTFGILYLHTFVVNRASPDEIPGMIWFAMIFPGLSFLLGYVNLRAYYRAVADPKHDLSKIYPQDLRSPEEVKAWRAQQQSGTKKDG